MNCRKRLAVLTITAISLYGIGVGSNQIDASTVTKDVNHWNIENGSLYIDNVSGSNYYVVQGKVEDSSNCISVLDRNVKLVLDNVDINTTYLVAPLEVGSGATVTLELVGDNKISGDYGIIVNQGGTLNIEGTGSLDITAESSAAIGNVMYSAQGLGDINIKGGEIRAQSLFGSAIGTCKGVDPIGNSTIGNISITGGYIEAYGSMDSAAIGAGVDSIYSNITIGGDAVVKAVSSSSGAGIGGGLEENIDNITYGSIVIADNATVESYSYSGAGIGSGEKRTDKTGIVNVEIKGSASVYSESQWGEAIGSGVSKELKPVDNSSILNNTDNTDNIEVDLISSIETKSSILEPNSSKFETVELVAVSNDSNIKLVDNSSVSCISYYNDALGKTDSDIVIMNFKSVPLEDTNITLISEEGKNVVVEVPGMCKSIATKLESGKYVCEVDAYGVELDEKSKDTFNPVVISDKGEKNLVELVNATEVLPEVVYVSNEAGSNSNTGFSKDEPIRDFDKAYNRVATNGKIVVCGKTEINTDIIKSKDIAITSRDENTDYREHGAELLIDFDSIKIEDNVKLSSINIDMKDSNISMEQQICLSANDTVFRKDIDSKLINTVSIVTMADTKTNIDYKLKNDSYLVCWSDTYKEMYNESLKGQILCMNDEKPQWSK